MATIPLVWSFAWHALLLAWFQGGEASRLRLHSTKKNADVKLRLDNFQNVQYSAPLTLDHQTLPVIYDTGSFEIIVLSTLCMSCYGGQAVYDSSKSVSFSSGDVIAEHLFGSGPVTSQKGYETVYFGNANSPYVVQRMPFWQVINHNIAVWNENAQFSGIVGLGHPAVTPAGFGSGAQEATFLQALGINMFSLCLQRTAGAPGWLAVGPSVDNSIYSGNFASVNVVGQVHWGVKMTSFQIPGIPGRLCDASCAAIVDSGTSLIAVPPMALPMMKQLGSYLKKDCSNIHSMPVLQLMLDGLLIELPPSAYVMQIQSTVQERTTIWELLFDPPDAKLVSQCVLGFMSLEKSSQFGPVWILGMPFLRHYYTIFDRTSKKLHIAHATPTCEVAGRSGAASLVNTTGLEGSMSGSRYFTAADYQPTKANLSAARVPAWALAAGKGLGNMSSSFYL